MIGIEKEILFIPPHDLRPSSYHGELWEGPKLGPDDADAPARTGFPIVKSVTLFQSELLDALKRQAWQRLIESYFEQRQCLRGVVVVMDCRHPLTEFDQQMLLWCGHAGLPVHLLLTKADKLSRGAASAVLHQVRSRLALEYPSPAAVTVQLFSALKRSGLAEAQEILAKWMEFDKKKGPGL